MIKWNELGLNGALRWNVSLKASALQKYSLKAKIIFKSDL